MLETGVRFLKITQYDAMGIVLHVPLNGHWLRLWTDRTGHLFVPSQLGIVYPAIPGISGLSPLCGAKGRYRSRRDEMDKLQERIYDQERAVYSNRGMGTEGGRQTERLPLRGRAALMPVAGSGC